MLPREWDEKPIESPSSSQYQTVRPLPQRKASTTSSPARAATSGTARGEEPAAKPSSSSTPSVMRPSRPNTTRTAKAAKSTAEPGTPSRLWAT